MDMTAVLRSSTSVNSVLLAVVCAVFSFGIASRQAFAADLTPSNLRCEYLTNPLSVSTTEPRLSWILDSAERGQKQTAYQVLAASAISNLRQEKGDLWDSGKVESDQSIHVAYSGKALSSRMRVAWKVRVWDKDGQAGPWSDPATFGVALLEGDDWKARWISDRTPLPPVIRTDGAKGVERYDAQPATMLRKEFVLPAKPTRATLYASALGVYEARMNGRRVGTHILAPEWTDYHKRVQSQTYDVTPLVCAGTNVTGCLLGDGWYAGRLGMSDGLFQKLRGVYGRKPLFIAQLEIELPDGQQVTFVSDESWVSTKSGPIRSSDTLDGEVYDARREMPGWDQPGFAPRDWQTVEINQQNAVQLVPQPNEPICIIRDLHPVALTEPKPRVFVFDFGQNMVGWCRLRLDAEAGATVTLRHAEMLDDDGTIYTANLRSAPQVDRHISSGEEDQVFEPRFTYHGFRYVEVTGLKYKPDRDALIGRVFNSSSPVVGEFECSDPMLNQLWKNILWTQRANLMSVPTDCPQRDERLGWMGDIQAFSQTGIFQMDLAAFLKKWLQDVRDAQARDGRFADFSPHPYGPDERFSGAPAWGDAGVVVPWVAYVNYGDRRMLEEHFDSAKRWIEFVRSQNPELVWRKARGNDYDDWLNGDTLKQEGWPTKGGAVPNELFATAFFARSTDLVSRMARVLGRAEDERRYAALFHEIKAAFQNAFVRPDGTLLGETQAGYALALNFDLLPESLRTAAVERMMEALKKYDNRFSTGIQSTHRLLLELTRYGHHEVAGQLVRSRAFPSWGYMIENGATTIWERWDGYVKGRGFQDAGMNSFNHWAFGAVGEWMFRHLAGINPHEEAPGYKHFVVRPRPISGVTWAKAKFDSSYGVIRSEWKMEGGKFSLNLRVPANTTATVYLPAAHGAAVLESGQVAEAVPGIRLVHHGEGTAVFEIGSGQYHLSTNL